MEVGEDLIGHLAELSALRLNARERRALRADLEQILCYLRKLEELDLDGAGLADADKSSSVLRADTPDKSLSQEQATSNAPQLEGPFFKVPPIMET